MDDKTDGSRGRPTTEATVFAPGAGGVRPGTRLNGVYEIDALIANGGMGEVYRGHNIQTQDPVAIKMILSELAGNADAFALFRREASTLHNMNHEAIVRYFVFSVDPVLQRAYLAMEYVEGPSLAALLKRGPLGVDSVEILRRRLADALETAHRFGVIHRDISSDNIILPDGDVRRAKIIDFGIARSLKPGEGTIIGGGFAGKYNYVSPEQLGLAGGDVTAKSDIYSLGLVLAEALRGRPIDMSGSQLEIIEKRRVVPDLSDIPAAMRPLLTAMLQPLPADRPASMADVAAWGAPPAQTYRPLPPPQPVPSAPPVAAVPTRRRLWPWFLFLPVATMVAALAVFALLGLPKAIRQPLLDAGVPQAWLQPFEPRQQDIAATDQPPQPPPLPPLPDTEKLPKVDGTDTANKLPPLPPLADGATDRPVIDKPEPSPSGPGTEGTDKPADGSTTGVQDADRLREQLVEAAEKNRAENDKKRAEAKAAADKVEADRKAADEAAATLAAEKAAALAKAAADKAAAAKSAADKAAADLAAQQAAAASKAAADKAAQAKAAAEKAAAEAAAGKAAAEKLAAAQAAAEKAAAEKAAARKAAAEKAAAEKAAAEKAAAAKAAADQAAREKAAAEKAAAEKAAAAKAAADQAAADKAALDKAAADKAAADQAAREKAAADQRAADQAAAEKAAADAKAASEAAAANTKVARVEPPRAPQSILAIAGAKVGEPYVANLPPFDDGSPASLALSAAQPLPDGLKLIDHGKGIGEISGSPTKAGVFTFDIVATNAAGLQASMTTMLTITDAPASTQGEKVATLSPRDAILKTVRGFDGGPCFYIRSVEATGTSATIEGFGTKPAPFEALDKAVLGAHGFEPLIAVRSVTAAQCVVLDFAATLNRGVANTPTISLQRADIRPGEPVIGRIDGIGGRQLAFLLVTNDGTVINLARGLTPAADGATFNLPLKSDAQSLKTAQVLIAVTSDTPLQTLADFRSAPVSDIVPRLQAELAETPGAALDVQRFRFVE